MNLSVQSSEKDGSLSELHRYHRTDGGKVRKVRGFTPSKAVKEVHECEDPHIGLCITDLPRPILIDILSGLPLKSVLICLCVCKTWRNLIKDSEFVKLHFSRTEAYPLIRPIGPTYISRILYFVDQPPKCNPGYDSGSKYCECYLKMKLDTKLKIPLHNAELAMNGEEEAKTNLQLKRKRIAKLRPKVHKLNLVNFCHGFLCLSEPSHNDPVMVCNPITREFIKLPVPTKSNSLINCGLGFCPKTNQFKVVRVFDQEEGRRRNIEPVTGRARLYCTVAEVHTLGTNTWKMVGSAPSLLGIKNPTYLNGTLNWLHLSFHGSNVPYYIVSFDIGEEKFQSIPIPPKKYDELGSYDKERIWIGEMRGCLCVSDASDDGIDKIELWVMKKYGVESSWKIEIKIDISTLRRFLRCGPYELMSNFKDGTVLFFESWSSSMLCYDADDKKLRILKVCGRKSRFEAISYIPSFISLKDAMIGDVEVYDLKSSYSSNLKYHHGTDIGSERCGVLKLQGESKAVFFMEESDD